MSNKIISIINIIVLIINILLFIYLYPSYKYNKDTKINIDTTYNTIIIDSIKYNISIRDSIIYNYKKQFIYETEIINSECDSNAVIRFKQLTSTN